MRINEILLESHSLEEGPFSQAVGKAVGGVAKGAGAVAGGIAGIPKAFKKGFDAGKKTVGGDDAAPTKQSKVKASDGQTYTWKGAQWISDQTGKIATRAIAQELAKSKDKVAAKANPKLDVPNPTLSGIAKGLAGDSGSASGKSSGKLSAADTYEAKQALKVAINGNALEPQHIRALKVLLKSL